MSTMQAFYNNLVSADKPSNPYLDSLLRLTRISIDKIKVFKSVISWDLWGE